MSPFNYFTTFRPENAAGIAGGRVPQLILEPYSPARCGGENVACARTRSLGGFCRTCDNSVVIPWAIHLGFASGWGLVFVYQFCRISYLLADGI